MTLWFCRNGKAGFASALILITGLGGCAPTPIGLVSAVDMVLTATDDEPVSTGPISIEEMLANARDAGAAQTAPALPTATLERAPEGMDGPAYIALGTFLSDLNPAQSHTIVVTRGESSAADPFADAQFAVLVGQLIKRAGHAVELTISPVQTTGSLHLAVRTEEAA